MRKNSVVEAIVKSKKAARRQLASKPVAEKLAIVEQLAERALALREDSSSPIPDEPWQIPPNWRWKKMGEIAKVVGGGTPRTDHPEYFGGDIAWITPADLSTLRAKAISSGARSITRPGLEHSGAQLLPAGTVLFSSRAPIGYVAIAANPLTTNQGFRSFVLSSELDPTFVYYYLLRARDLAVALASGTTFLEISGKNAARLPVPVPPVEEQRRIVAEIEKQLTRLDAGTASLLHAKNLLKRYRLSVLRAAFDGYFTVNSTLPGIDRGLPSTWKWVSLGQLGNVVRGASPRPAGDSRYFGGSIPWITVGLLTADHTPYLTATPNTVTEEGRKRSRYIEPGTLLLTNSGATLGVPKITIIGGCINDGVAAILDVPEELKLYLLYFLRSQTEQLRGVNQGAAQPNLNTTIIKNIRVPLAPASEHRTIVSEIEHRLSVVDELEYIVNANIQRASNLRQSLLDKAFSGQL